MGAKAGVMGVSLTVLVLVGARASSAQEAGDAIPTSLPPTTAPSALPEPAPQIVPPPADPPNVVVTTSPTEPPEAVPEALPPPPPEAPAEPPAPVPAPAPDIPVLSRTPKRDTSRLVALLEPLTEWGVPLEEVLPEGMGRFPVIGSAHYADDWLAPRYEPSFHLHKGLDIFADFGTPVRAPTAGVVTRFSDAYPGGTGVWMRDQEGTTYYFAHLMSRAEDLEVGQSVELGTLLGYVGNTGNASGGSPHVHLEIRRGGVAVPPKPFVDGWLDEAEQAAGDLIERMRLRIEVERHIAMVLADWLEDAG